MYIKLHSYGIYIKHTFVCVPNHTKFVHEEECTDFVQGPETDSHTIRRYLGSTEGNDGIPKNSTG